MARRSNPTIPVAGGPVLTPRSLGAPGWWLVLVVAAVFVAYLPALSCGFIWDDAGHVTRADLRPLSGLFRIWFEFGATQQYYPVLHSAFWFEHLLWGDNPLGYHLLNVLLHAAAASLFGLVLRRLAVSGAWIAALLFALHPVCVESVAWVTEQKNTLSTVFYLAAALAYLRFRERPQGRAYLLATALFGFALLTKTVTATLPAALLVVGWWQRGRLDWRKDVAPLLPWFVLGAASGLVTAHFERTLIGAEGADFALSAVERSLLAGRVLWFYLGKLVWPAELIFIYPRWTIDAGLAWQWLFPIGAILGLGGLLAWQRQQRGPLAAGLLFSGALFPVLGFVNVYPFVFSYVADHFQYLATLPVFALAGAGLTRFAVRLPGWGGAMAAVVLLGGLGTLTWDQAGMYRDSTTLFETTLDRNPDCWMAHHNLAVILAGEGRFAEALSHQQAAVRLYPDYAPAENNLGDDLLQLNRVAEALPHLERAIRLHPNYAVAHCNLGLALARLERTDEALRHFAEAVRLQPAYAEAELNWGLGLMLTGHFREALPHFEQALRLNPNSVDAHHTFGRALASQGRHAEAIVQFREALRLAPEYGDAHLDLALALREIGQEPEAREHERAAQRLRATP